MHPFPSITHAPSRFARVAAVALCCALLSFLHLSGAVIDNGLITGLGGLGSGNFGAADWVVWVRLGGLGSGNFGTESAARCAHAHAHAHARRDWWGLFYKLVPGRLEGLLGLSELPRTPSPFPPLYHASPLHL